MTTLLIVLTCVVAYLAVGFFYFAPWWINREVEKAIRRWSHVAEDADEIADQRRFAASLAWLPALFWPFCWFGHWLTNRLAATTPITTHELKLKSEQQAKRIADLERELGIGRS